MGKYRIKVIYCGKIKLYRPQINVGGIFSWWITFAPDFRTEEEARNRINDKIQEEQDKRKTHYIYV